jgi:hypothetical protein
MRFLPKPIQRAPRDHVDRQLAAGGAPGEDGDHVGPLLAFGDREALPLGAHAHRHPVDLDQALGDGLVHPAD